jgi:hypothetical protein
LIGLARRITSSEAAGIVLPPAPDPSDSRQSWPERGAGLEWRVVPEPLDRGDPCGDFVRTRDYRAARCAAVGDREVEQVAGGEGGAA